MRKAQNNKVSIDLSLERRNRSWGVGDGADDGADGGADDDADGGADDDEEWENGGEMPPLYRKPTAAPLRPNWLLP